MMINAQIKSKLLNGFDFFSIVCPIITQEDDKLILQFANNTIFFGYEKYLITLLNEIRLDEALHASLLMNNKVKFIVELLAELQRFKFISEGEI